MKRLAAGLTAVIAIALADPALALERLPLEAFFASPEIDQLEISPDGKFVAGIARGGTRQRVVVIELATRSRRDVVAFDDRPIHAVWWGNDERLIVSYAKNHGRAPRFLLVDRDGRNERARACEDLVAKPSLSSGRGSDSAIRGRGWLHEGGHPIAWLPRDPNHVLIGLIGAATRAFAAVEVHRLDLRHCTAKLVLSRREQGLTWFADSSGTVRAGIGQRRLQGRLLYRKAERARWLELEAIGEMPITPRSLVPRGFAPGDRELLVLSRHAGDRFSLYGFDPETAALSAAILSDPLFDIAAWIETSRDGRPIALTHVLAGWETRWLDSGLAAQATHASALAGGAKLQLGSLDRSEARILFHAHSSRAPGQTLLYHEIPGQEPRIDVLATECPALEAAALAEPSAIRFRARDGLEIPAYLTLPPGGGPFPALLLVNDGPLANLHGGMPARALRDFDPELQFLVNRGYAVLQANTRGTPGYGLDFELRGDEQWGRAMQDDLEDGARWLIDHGHADPKRICIYGRGYGGYAALWGAIRSPELFRCAASLGGISDLSRFQTLNRRFVYDEVAEVQVGEEITRLREVSPLMHVAKLRVPVLLAHGEYDEFVRSEQTLSFAAALTRAGKPHELLILDEEGHGVPYWEEQRLKFYRALEAFLDRHLAAGAPAVKALDTRVVAEIRGS